MSDLMERLPRIEEKLGALLEERVSRDYYSTSDVAEILRKSEYTVREWCRLGRVNGEKREGGRGNAREWMISHAELQRIHSKGLMPANGQNNG